MKGAEITRPLGFRVSWFAGLEVNPQANFHLPSGIDRTGDSPEVLRSRQGQAAGIRRLVMIKDVGKLHRQGGAHALRELEVLAQRQIHVPSIQTSEIANTTATAVNPENTSPKLTDNGGRVGEIVNLARVVCAYPYGHAIHGRRGTGNAEVGSGTIGEGPDRKRAFKGAAPTRDIAHFTKSLAGRTSALAVANSNWEAALGG